MKDQQIIHDLIFSLKQPMRELEKLQKQKLMIEKDNVDYIINNKIKNKLEIEKVLDNLLELTYWYGDEMKEIFYKLLNYLKNIDIKLCEDYQTYYLEIIEEE